MLKFRYACLRHQQMFVAAVTQEGCRDADQMERIRQQMFAWVSERLPFMVLDAFNAKACLGCAIEAAQISTAELYDALQGFVRASASGTLPTDARHR